MPVDDLDDCLTELRWLYDRDTHLGPNLVTVIWV